jgi:hypothetical protein
LLYAAYIWGVDAGGEGRRFLFLERKLSKGGKCILRCRIKIPGPIMERSLKNVTDNVALNSQIYWRCKKVRYLITWMCCTVIELSRGWGNPWTL